MPTTNTPIFPQTIQNWAVTIANADASTKKTLLTGGTNGTKVEFLELTSDDSSTRDIIAYLSDGTTDYILGRFNVNANSGNTAAVTTPPYSVLQGGNFPNFPYDNNGNRYLYLKSGWSLKFATQTTVTSGKFIFIKAFGADY